MSTRQAVPRGALPKTTPAAEAAADRMASHVVASMGSLHAGTSDGDGSVPRAFERAFGCSFESVRIFSNHEAGESARSMSADAYTYGRAIVFGHGRYRPHTSEGRHLLAHELAHVVQQQTTGPMIQRRCARRMTIDDDYQLCRSADATTVDWHTHDYALSSGDIERLRRWHGYYFIGTYLITPPEVRRAAGHRAHAVLIPLAPTDLLHFPTDPEGTVRRVVQETLGVTVRRMTHSTEPDFRFASRAPPAVVQEALTVGSTDSAAARERAAGTTQAHTLSEATRSGERLPTGSLERQSPGTVNSMPQAERADWYVARLGPFQSQLLESARAHHIPMQLLAAVILNELADINIVDTLQAGHGRGSLGIAQIQVTTAERDHLVDPVSGRSVGDLLEVPQIGIEAAAREIVILLERMSNHLSSPFQRLHGYTARGGAQGDAIYDHIAGETRQLREANLAHMVTAAYNSPDIIVTRAERMGRYRNAIIHGNNGRRRALDLYELGLFRGVRPRSEARARTASLAVHPVTSMRFDGSTLTVVGADGETRYPVLSGLRPNNPHNYDGLDHTGPSSEALPDMGPIPAGTYTIEPGEVEYGGFSAEHWGPLRVRIHEDTLTGLSRRIFTRREGGFFLHEDVGRDGTAGCIGLQSRAAIREVIARIARTETTIPVTVEHTNPPTPMPPQAPHRRPTPTPHAPPRRRRRRRRRHH